MNYRVEGALRKNKKNFIIFAILWVFIAVVLVSAFSNAIVMANAEGNFNVEIFIASFGKTIANPAASFSGLISMGGMTTYFKTLIIVTFIYAIFMVIGVFRSAPKNEYSDIEHGSSDWSQNGEQYRVLSNKKGIILAEDNYLPVDKRGNVNVLVVGRFRCW